MTHEAVGTCVSITIKESEAQLQLVWAPRSVGVSGTVLGTMKMNVVKPQHEVNLSVCECLHVRGKLLYA